MGYKMTVPPSPTSGSPVHASLLALDGRGVVFVGGAGSGKSSALLRLLRRPDAQLVADDRVVLTARNGAAWGQASPVLAGQVEVRGVGVVRLPYLDACAIALVVALVTPAAVPRLAPEAYWAETPPDCAPVPEIALSLEDPAFEARLRVALLVLTTQGFPETGVFDGLPPIGKSG